MGKVEIDHTGSGSGITLSSDGTSLLLDGTAIGGGGGGADLYAANESSPTAQPSATGANAIAIGDSATASGEDAVAIGDGAVATGNDSVALGASRASDIGAFAAGIYNNSTTYGARGRYGVAIGRFATSTTSGWNTAALGPQSVGSGDRATALTNSYASGTDSLAAAIANNTSSYGAVGANSVAIGQNARAAQSNAIALGGSSLANGVYSFAFNGTTSGAYSVAFGGTASGSVAVSLKGATASGDRSLAVGFRAVSSRFGQKAFANGRFAADGDAQGSMFILRAATTDATATVLTADQGSAASTNQIVAASDTCITFDGTITAMQNGAQAYASWRIEGLLVNDGGTTTLANSATTVIQNLSSWGMALSADNTNNALAITCTGEASHNIRWVANIRTTEVTYA